MFKDRVQSASAKRRAPTPFAVKAWGVTVHLTTLGAGKLVELLDLVKVDKHEADFVLVASCLCDENGATPFTAAEVRALEMDGVAEILHECAKRNGLSGGDEAEAKKPASAATPPA